MSVHWCLSGEAKVDIGVGNAVGGVQKIRLEVYYIMERYPWKSDPTDETDDSNQGMGKVQNYS